MKLSRYVTLGASSSSSEVKTEEGEHERRKQNSVSLRVVRDRNGSSGSIVSPPSPVLSMATSTSRGSTMTFGSSLGQDSFVVMSTSGLSDKSLDRSPGSYDPYIGRHCSNGIKDGSAFTSRLPRLNVRTALTEDLHMPPPPSSMQRNRTDAKKPPQVALSPEGRDHRSFVTAQTSEKENDKPSSHPPLTTILPHPCSPSAQNLLGLQREPSAASNTTGSSAVTSPAHAEKKKCRKRAAAERHAALAQREYFKRLLMSRVVSYGPDSLMTAEGLMNLAGAHMRCKEFAEALSVFKSGTRILRHVHGSHSLPLARALDKVGLAASRCPGTSGQNLDWALVALTEAFHIRYKCLGPWHCDVVDTLNNIAGVHLHRRELDLARDAYLEVLTVRAAIFGKTHPSVAVTAQTLGNVLMRLSIMDEALKYYGVALHIFKSPSMNLKDGHPMLAKVRRDIASTERIMVSMGYR